jgi:predicted nucleic-acid-binding protein
MRVTVDTNILVRALVHDDSSQAVLASRLLKEASVVAVSLSCLCEFVWVLKYTYKFTPKNTALAIRALIAARNVEVNQMAVEAGLSMLETGADFADGIIALEGQWLGGEIFVSFDKKAVSKWKKQGQPARLLTKE